MKRISIVLFVLALLLTACVPTSTDSTVEAELRETLVALRVEQTLQASKIAELTNLLEQPTATCPVCPTLEPTPTTQLATSTPVPTEIPPEPSPTSQPLGSLSGSLGYPSEFIPPLRVVAINTLTGEYYWQNTVLNQSSYYFTELPEGKYYVLAYLIEEPSEEFFAGYSQFVECGLSVECTDHSLIEVEIKAGQESTGINPVDWYADPAASGWPLDPTINWD